LRALGEIPSTGGDVLGRKALRNLELRVSGGAGSAPGPLLGSFEPCHLLMVPQRFVVILRSLGCVTNVHQLLDPQCPVWEPHAVGQVEMCPKGQMHKDFKGIC